MTCRFVASDQPRVINRRHDDDCPGEECKGCLPCTEPHCVVCGKEHHEGACPACAGEAREDLEAIRTLSHSLPSEARNRGIDSEAMALMLPAADPEAWGHITTSVLVGRLPEGYLRCDRCKNPWPCQKHADGELHPLFVLGTWEMVWRDALDHEVDGDRVATIEDAARYLGQQLTYMADYEHAPFEDFARDLRRCRKHLESVLHDGEQVDRGAPCLKCKRPLTRTWGKSEAEDGWECKPCHASSNQAQYSFAMKAEYIDRAPWLTDADMETRTEVKAATVRSWARDDVALVRKQLHSQRTVYSVIDVQNVAESKGVPFRDTRERPVA